MDLSEFDLQIKSIASGLINYTNETIAGSLLGELIRSNAPSINIREVVSIPSGPGAQSKFIEQYLSGYLEPTSNRQGMDVVYKIIRDPHDANIIHRQSSPAFWKAFVNISDQNTLYVDILNKELRIAPSYGSSISDNFLVINNMQQSELDAITDDFLNELALIPELAELKDQLKNSSNYSIWVQTLRAHGTKEYIRWSLFRRQKIESIFRDRLVKLKIEDSLIKQLLMDLKRSQKSAKKVREVNAQKSSQKNIVKKQGFPKSTSDVFFRDMLQSTISRMSIEELRQLRIPFGVAFDAISDQLKK